jgi:exopolysaccharide biosynthesis protein
MKKVFPLLCYLMIGLAIYTGCSSSNTDPDPCETDPQPGCPNYVDPCVANPQPGCPDYDPVPTPTLASTITLGTTTYTVDDTSMEEFEDGFWYLYARLENANKPLIIHSVRYRTSTTGYSIEAWSGKDSINGKETPSAMVNRYEAVGRRVKMAINGGFYGTSVAGIPTGVEVVNGMMTCLGDVAQPSIGFDDNNMPYIDNLTFNAKVKNKDGVESAITTVNGTRWENYLVLFNSAKGKRTGTNQWGTEVLCAPKTGQWETLDNYINIPCRIELVEPMSGKGNMAIPKGKIVLAGNDNLSNTLQTGDDISITVDYTLQYDPNVNSTVIHNVVSGYNIVLKDNIVVEPDLTLYPPSDHALLTGNEPRTSVGFSADKEYVYFTIVEGRRTGIAAGVSTFELGQVMKYLGAANAINLDGGGSSCLMIDKETKNYCTDGSQRAVCNGLAIIKK